jgi:hypothetical protein
MTQKQGGGNNRQEPLGEVKRELWVLSGNECAWRDCHQRLLAGDGAWIGKIAHIVGAEKGSARHDATWEPEQLRDVSNLVLLCGVHHDMIDHPDSRDQYPPDFLCEMKREHEARFRRAFQGFEEEFLNVTGANRVTPSATLGRFMPDADPDERAGNALAVNGIADYLATLTLGARQLLAFLVSLDRPIDIYELARHNGEAQPDRTGRLVQELESRRLARVEDYDWTWEMPNLVVLWTDASGSVFDGWDTFWNELRDHMASRTDATLSDVIIDLDFSLLD